MIEIPARPLIALTGLILLLGSGLYLWQHYQTFVDQPRAVALAEPNRVQPLPTEVRVSDFSIIVPSNTWQAHFSVPMAELQATVFARYPRFQRRFPDGIQLIFIDKTQAPEPLRGSYDPDPAQLRIGAIHPLPAAGQSLPVEAEAWAGCRRDLELGAAASLICYIYARGYPGATLDGLVTLAWVGAMDVALSGRSYVLDPTALHFLTAGKDGDQWTYTDAYLSLSPSP